MERVCFLLKVKADRLDEYKLQHKQVWPEMLQALTQAGWGNYSLFLRHDGMLVGYLETPDFQQALKQMDSLEINRRWQEKMKPFFVSSGGRPDEDIERIEEVFHID